MPCSWDDWVPVGRIRKHTEENKVIAAQMLEQYNQTKRAKAQKDKSAKSKRTVNGSDLGSTRGSEERGPPATQSGRGPRGRRDYDLEAVSYFIFSLSSHQTRRCLATGWKLDVAKS